jgi:hypothetical protein
MAAYTLNVPFTFGSRVDFAQLIKSYASQQEVTRYSPATITGIEKITRFGNPDEDTRARPQVIAVGTRAVVPNGEESYVRFSSVFFSFPAGPWFSIARHHHRSVSIKSPAPRRSPRFSATALNERALPSGD